MKQSTSYDDRSPCVLISNYPQMGVYSPISPYYSDTQNRTYVFGENVKTEGFIYETYVYEPEIQNADRRGIQKHKIQLCRAYSQMGYCPYGHSCMFAHGIDELTKNQPSLKVRFCKNFYEKGYCRFGKRCNFRHDKIQALQSSLGTINNENNEINNNNAAYISEMMPYTQSMRNREMNIGIDSQELKMKKKLKEKIQQKNLQKLYKRLKGINILPEYPEIFIEGYRTANHQKRLLNFTEDIKQLNDAAFESSNNLKVNNE